MKRGVKIAIFAIAAAAIIGFLIYWNNPEVVYNREIEQLHIYISDGNEAQAKKLMERTQSSGDWGKLERAVKDYLSDHTAAVKTLNELQADEQISSALDAKSLKDNGPNFSSILDKLASAKKKLETAREQYNRSRSPEDAAKKNANNLPEQYLEKFKTTLKEKFANDDARVNLSDAFKMMQGMIETYISELKMLAENAKSWSVKDGRLQFSSDAIKELYNKILRSVSKVK